MTISKDRVKPSPLPDSWKLKEIFATGVALGGYLALMTVIFFWIMHDTDFFSVRLKLILTSIKYIVLFLLLIFVFLALQEKFKVKNLRLSTDPEYEMMAALYLQVSIVSQALIFVTRSRSWSFVERPGFLLMFAFLAAQLVMFFITF